MAHDQSRAEPEHDDPIEAVQRAEQAERMAAVADFDRDPKRRRRWPRIVGGIAIVLLVVVALAPTAAGPLLRSAVESRLEQALGANVRIESLSLSWFGDQSIRGLRIVDGALQETANVTIRAERSLLALARDRNAVGTIVVSGNATLTQRDDGSWAPLPPASPDESDDPASLPADLSAALRFDGFDLTLHPAGGRPVALERISGVVGIDELDIDSTIEAVVREGQAESALRWSGTVAGLLTERGLGDPRAATIRASVSAESAASVARAFSSDGWTDLGEGPIDLELAVEKGQGTLSATLEADNARLSLDADVAATESGFRVALSGEPASARIGGPLVGALSPAAARLAREPVTVGDGRTFSLDAAPGGSLTISRLIATIDQTTWTLGDTRFEAVFETDRLTGTLGDARWTVEPLLGTAVTRDIRQGVDLELVTEVTLDGERAGEISLLADGLRPVDAEGAPVTDIASILAGSRARLDASEVATAVIEPLIAPVLAGTGVVPTRDLGPVVSAEFTLSPGATTSLRLGLTADNAEASLGFQIDEGILRTTDDASRIRIASAAPILAELLESSGVRVAEGAAIDVRLSEFAVDLDAARRDGPLRFNTLAGSASASIGRTAGTIVVDGVERSFTLRPSELELDARRIAEGASLVAGAAVDIDGRAAGNLSVSVEATGLLADDGTLRSGIPSLTGEAALRGLRADLLDPWLEPLGLTADAMVGNAADLILIGARGDGDAVNLQLRLESGALQGGGDLVVADRELRNTGPLRFEHPRSATLLAALASGRLEASGGGTLGVTIDTIRLGAGGLSELETSIEARELAATGEGGLAVSIDRLNATASLGSADATVEINGVGQIDGTPIMAGGRLTLASVRDAAGAFAPLAATPEGRIDLTIPASAADLFVPALASGWEDVLRLTVGDAMEVSLAAEGGRSTLEASVTSGATSLRVLAETGGGTVSITSGELRSRVSQQDVVQLRLSQTTATGRAASGPMLSSEAEFDASFTGFGLVRDGVFAPSGITEVRLTGSGSVEGLRAGRAVGSDGIERAIRTGELGVEGLTIQASVPVGALAASGTADLAGEIRGTVVGENGAPVTAITGRLSAAFDSGTFEGPVTLSVELPEIEAALIDDALRTDSYFAGLLGANASASAELSGIAEAGLVSDAGLTLSINSPRIATRTPMVFDVRSDRIELAQPVDLAWTLDPVFATRHLLHQEAGEERVRLARPIETVFAVDRLTLGRHGRPFRPDVFGAHLNLSAPRVVIEQLAEREAAAGSESDEPEWLTADLSPLSGELVTRAGEGVTLSMTAAEGTEQSLIASLNLRGLNAGTPMLGVLVEGRRLPSQAIDGLGDLGGGLAEVVGPFTQIRLDVQNLTRSEGSVNLSIVGDRATTRLIGEVNDGIFRNTDPVTLMLDVIRPQLGNRLARAVPALGKVTKTRDDGPATATITAVSMPIHVEKPLSRLDADFTIDVGTARFEASTAFGELLKLAQQPVDNQVGRQLEPMVGTVRQGQISYERFKIPLGEVTLLSEGAYHLTTKQTDITTYIPLGALSDKAMGVLNTGLGAQFTRIIPGLERVTMIPWRVSGVPGSLTIRPDLDALRRDVTGLLNPVNVIDGVVSGVGSVFGG